MFLRMSILVSVIRSKDVFEQLFGIHAFVRKADALKQVPLVFVFMSRKRKKDYKKVLNVVNCLSDNLNRNTRTRMFFFTKTVFILY